MKPFLYQLRPQASLQGQQVKRLGGMVGRRKLLKCFLQDRLLVRTDTDGSDFWFAVLHHGIDVSVVQFSPLLRAKHLSTVFDDFGIVRDEMN